MPPLLSLAALRDADNDDVLDHCRRVAEVIPIVGFYLQPAVGGRVLDRAFWRGFLDIERVVAIKVAPFDRYRTLDVTTALAESGRQDVALYTGNDDAIVTDLLTPFPPGDDGRCTFLAACSANGPCGRSARSSCCDGATRRGPSRQGRGPRPLRLLALGAELTDVERRAVRSRPSVRRLHPRHSRSPAPAGPARGTLVPRIRTRTLSPGQMDDIDRVLARYPHLTDDEFVKEHLHRWLS